MNRPDPADTRTPAFPRNPSASAVQLALSVLTALMLSTLVVSGCGGRGATPTPDVPVGQDFLGYVAVDEPSDHVVIEMETGDLIVLELDAEAAPLTVANFRKLVGQGFYNGVGFHRIIEGFMIQGGDPTGTGSGGPGWSIKGEFSDNGIDNPLKHRRGVLSMARTNAPNSAGSQFFIMHQDKYGPSLDGKYAAFGRVVEGMDAVDRIALSDTDANDRPLSPVIMKRVFFAEPKAEG